MRIWLINQYAVPATQAGITRHYDLARELVSRGHEVLIVASSFDHVTRRERRLASAGAGSHFIEDVDGVRFLWLKTPPYRGNSGARIWNMGVFAAGVSRLNPAGLGMPRPDVILGSSPQILAAWASQRLACRIRVPFVLEVRDLWPQSLVDLGDISEHHPVTLGLRGIERHLYRSADRIVTLLPGSIDYISARGGDRGRIHWVPNGVVLNRYAQPKPPNETDTLTVVYAGSHGLINALDNVLDAAQILLHRGDNRIRFRFIGDGPDKPRLQKRTAAEGIRTITFDNPVPKREVYSVLAGADAFVLSLLPSPLYRWGISVNKLVDYLALARPTILAGDPGNDPVAEAGAGFTVPPGDPTALADALSRLAGLPLSERWRMGQRGRAYVEKHHDLHQLGARLERVLEAACVSARERRDEPTMRRPDRDSPGAGRSVP